MRGPMAAERPEEAQCLPPGGNVINLRYHGVKFLFVGQLRRSRSLPPGGKVGRRQAGRKGNGDMLRKVCSMDKNMIHPASQHLSTVHS